MEHGAWCESQTKCQEDLVDPNSWTCTAHLADGVAMQCPFVGPSAARANCVDFRLNEMKGVSIATDY